MSVIEKNNLANMFVRGFSTNRLTRKFFPSDDYPERMKAEALATIDRCLNYGAIHIAGNLRGVACVSDASQYAADSLGIRDLATWKHSLAEWRLNNLKTSGALDYFEYVLVTEIARSDGLGLKLVKAVIHAASKSKKSVYMETCLDSVRSMFKDVGFVEVDRISVGGEFTNYGMVFPL